jgi:methyl-accepting chemotaxis protein
MNFSNFTIGQRIGALSGILLGFLAIIAVWAYSGVGNADAASASNSASNGLMYAGVLAFLLGLAASVVIARSIKTDLQNIVNGIGGGSEHITMAAGQVSTASQALAEGASRQAASVEETSSSLEEMSAMTKQNADNSRVAAELTAQSTKHIEDADSNVVNMTGAMEKIKSATDQTSKIIKTIDEIAFQTNLLALNAAVEAARAGEAGKGFAVVAEEVRNLAMRSADAARNTSELIADTVARVNNGVQVVSGLKEVLSEVMSSSKKIAGLVSEISSASSEQSTGVDQANKAMVAIEEVTQQNAATAEENASASEELVGQAESMRGYVLNLNALVSGRQDQHPHSASRLAPSKFAMPSRRSTHTR